MEKYVRQLLADLQEAKTRKPEKPNLRVLYPNHRAFDYDLDYIAEWEMSPEIPMQELFGIDAMQFPSVDKLLKGQINLLVDGILDLWQEFNMYADFPEKLPIELKYKILVNRWNERVQYISVGMMHFTFCNYYPQECPFGVEYCSCKDFEDETTDDLFDKFQDPEVDSSLN